MPDVDNVAEAIGDLEYAKKWLTDIQDPEARDAISMCLTSALAHLKNHRAKPTMENLIREYDL